MLTHVGITTIYVSDQQKALDFYTNTLGLETRADQAIGDGVRWIQVAPPGAETSIVLAQGFGEWSPEKVGQFTGMVFDTDDIAVAYQELSGRGVTFTEAPAQQPWGMMAKFVDQDGNRFALMQR